MTSLYSSNFSGDLRNFSKFDLKIALEIEKLLARRSTTLASHIKGITSLPSPARVVPRMTWSNNSWSISTTSSSYWLPSYDKTSLTWYFIALARACCKTPSSTLPSAPITSNCRSQCDAGVTAVLATATFPVQADKQCSRCDSVGLISAGKCSIFVFIRSMLPNNMIPRGVSANMDAGWTPNVTSVCGNTCASLSPIITSILSILSPLCNKSESASL